MPECKAVTKWGWGMLRILALVVAAALAGCAALPAAEKSKALGEGISATGQVVRESLSANRALAIRAGEEVEARKYMSRKAFSIKDSPGVLLDKANVAYRLAALSALEKYGDALAKAVDQGAVDSLEKASVNLGNAIAGLTTVAGAGAGLPLVAAPVIKVGARIAGFLIGNEYAAEIHAIIVAQDPNVRAVATLLRKDMQGVTELIQTNADLYELQRRQNLIALRDDPTVGTAVLYSEYKAARQDLAATLTLRQAAEKYDEVLKALVEAHQAIADNSPDGELLLRRFVALSTDLAELIGAAKKDRL